MKKITEKAFKEAMEKTFEEEEEESGFDNLILDKIAQLSIDQILRGLTIDFNLETIISCLDDIAKESGGKVSLNYK